MRCYWFLWRMHLQPRLSSSKTFPVWLREVAAKLDSSWSPWGLHGAAHDNLDGTAFPCSNVHLLLWETFLDSLTDLIVRDNVTDQILFFLTLNSPTVFAEKKTMIGWRNVWNMTWRAPDQEVDQRGHGERLCRKTAKHVIWTRRMLWIVVDGRSW